MKALKNRINVEVKYKKIIDGVDTFLSSNVCWRPFNKADTDDINPPFHNATYPKVE